MAWIFLAIPAMARINEKDFHLVPLVQRNGDELNGPSGSAGLIKAFGNDGQ
jgi:hypothetical protein